MAMNVGRLISGSQLLQKAEHIEYSTAARERSQNEGNVAIQNQNIINKEVENEANTWENDREQVKSMVEGINDFLKPTHTSLKFEFHDKLDKYYVQVVDSDTKEIIKEIPPKKLLDVYAAMAEFMGFIVDEKI